MTPPYSLRFAKQHAPLLGLLMIAGWDAPTHGSAPQQTAQVADPAHAAADVRDIRYEHGQHGDRLRIELTRASGVKHSRQGRRTRIEVSPANLATGLERTLDVAAYEGSIASVSSYRDERRPDQVIIEVEARRGDRDLEINVSGSVIELMAWTDAAHSMKSGRGSDGGAARKERTIAREEAIASMRISQSWAELAEEESVTQAGAFLPTSTAAQLKRVGGRKIAIDFQNTDIHQVLRVFSDVGRVNIVVADNVTGSVTIRMREVPWDQAMQTVLKAKGLGMVQQGNLIRVAKLDDLNKERELEIARAKSDLQLAPMETRLIPVSYALAKDLQERGKDLLSPRGTVAVDERTNVLIARDVSGNLDQVEELVRSLDTQTPQVLIEARVVEATSRYLRDVGIQWGGDASFSSATGNPTGLAFPSAVGIVGGASDQQTPTGGLSLGGGPVGNSNFAVNLPATVGTGQGGALGLSFGSINNSVNLAVRLSAAEQSGMLRIVSSPRVLTLDNREASISQGTLIPFSQVSAQGVQTTFQEAKLQLKVKPHVTADGSVSMQLKINRDEPDFNQTSARGDPTILKREAQTELLVPDGNTAVIGGIFTRNTGRNLDQIPVLGDIPILGVLFQRRRSSDTRTELVIFLTPRIVNRAEALGK